MCTLCLSDMGELRDEWLREPRQPLAALASERKPDASAAAPRAPVVLLPDNAAVAA